MGDEIQELSREGRRVSKLRSMEDSAVMCLVSALPHLEAIAFKNPDQNEEDFLVSYKEIAEKHRLNVVQKELALNAFRNYKKDRSEVLAYGGVVLSGSLQEPAQVFNEIEADSSAKSTFLDDLGVEDLSAEKTAKFKLENTCPSCFVIRFDGTSEELGEILLRESDATAAGFFAQKMFLDEEGARKDPKKAARVSLLSSRVILLTNPPPEKSKLLVDKPRTIRQHELRHYLFSLYWGREKSDNPQASVDSNARNELQVHILSDSWHFHINELLQGKLPESADGGSVYLRDFPEQTENLVDCLYEIRRLSGSGYKDCWLVGGILLTAGSLPEATRRLRKIGPQDENPADAYRGLLFLHNEVERPNQRRAMENDDVFFRAINSRVLALSPDEEVLKDHVGTLAHALKGHVYGGIGVSKEDVYENAAVVADRIKGLRQQFLDAGFDDLGSLDELVHEALSSETEWREREEFLRDWEEFLEHLEGTNPERFLEYEQLMKNRTYPGILKVKKYKEEKLETLFSNWRNQRKTKP